KGYIFDDTSRSAFTDDCKELNCLIGFLCSNVCHEYLKILNPTMSFTNGDIKRIPYLKNIISRDGRIENRVQQNISISKTDWDSFQTSWDFKVHPLLDKSKQGQVPNTIESAYENWKVYANNNFAKLKENEERLNELFIEIYGLEDELTPEVSDKD